MLKEFLLSIASQGIEETGEWIRMFATQSLRFHFRAEPLSLQAFGLQREDGDGWYGPGPRSEGHPALRALSPEPRGLSTKAARRWRGLPRPEQRDTSQQAAADFVQPVRGICAAGPCILEHCGAPGPDIGLAPTKTAHIEASGVKLCASKAQSQHSSLTKSVNTALQKPKHPKPSRVSSQSKPPKARAEIAESPPDGASSDPAGVCPLWRPGARDPSGPGELRFRHKGPWGRMWAVQQEGGGKYLLVGEERFRLHLRTKACALRAPSGKLHECRSQTRPWQADLRRKRPGM